MPLLIPIDDADDPRLAPYRDVVHSRDARASGLFVAEGEKLARRLWESSFETVSALVSERVVERLAPALPEGAPAYVVGDALIRRVVGFNFHRGVMACGRRRTFAAWDDLVGASEAPLRFVVCPAPNDPENLGGIIRNASAFGVAALLLSDRSIDPFSRRVLRVSMGTAFKLPIVESSRLLAEVRRLREAYGVTAFAATLDENAEPLASIAPPLRWALVFGSEGEGLSPEWIAACDRSVTIPMRRGVDSLNVAVAAGVFLYHFTSREATP